MKAYFLDGPKAGVAMEMDPHSYLQFPVLPELDPTWLDADAEVEETAVNVESITYKYAYTQDGVRYYRLERPEVHFSVVHFQCIGMWENDRREFGFTMTFDPSLWVEVPPYFRDSGIRQCQVYAREHGIQRFQLTMWSPDPYVESETMTFELVWRESNAR